MICVFHRYPSVAILLENGEIFSTRCVGLCPQRLSGRCSHIGALLYLIEEVKLGLEPKFYLTPTDRGQWWGKGCKTDRNPGAIGEKDYGRKLKEDRYKGFDPRPETLKNPTTKEEIKTFLERCQAWSFRKWIFYH